MTPDISQIIDIARECGSIIKNAFDTHVELKDQDRKSLVTMVTQYDVMVQEVLEKRLKEIMPEASFLGEEGVQTYQKNGYCFVCDPIDGTTNFVKNYNYSAVSIALLYDGKPVLGVVYNPYADEMFWAEKGKGAFCNGKRIHTTKADLGGSLVAFGTGTKTPDEVDKVWDLVQQYFEKAIDIRRVGAGALDLCNVACGRNGVFWELKLESWDYAAAYLVVVEAGGIVKVSKNEDITDFFAQSSIIATAHKDIDILF